MTRFDVSSLGFLALPVQKLADWLHNRHAGHHNKLTFRSQIKVRNHISMADPGHGRRLDAGCSLSDVALNVENVVVR